MSERFHTHVPGLPEAPFWLRVLAPALVYPLLIASIFIYQPFYDMMMVKEGGIEYLAVLLLLFGVVYGVRLLVKYRDLFPKRWLVVWYALVTLAAFVLAGEEISWGQHLGLWTHEQVPEAIRAVNDQNETNFHNMTNALDQGPTNLVVLGTVVAFIVLPIILRKRGETMGVSNPGYWFWPTRAGLIAGIGVLVIPFPKRIYEWTTGEEGPNLLRHSEVHEFYVALLLTIYLVSAHNRLRGLRQRESEATPGADAKQATPQMASSR